MNWFIKTKTKQPINRQKNNNQEAKQEMKTNSVVSIPTEKKKKKGLWL